MLSNADLQRSQSFKDRRISLFAQKCKEVHGPDVHLIIASGGNAGLAVACAANVLNVRAMYGVYCRRCQPEDVIFLNERARRNCDRR
jgi:L-serine/L-threonine ammonia-lyase